jgi:hypothetical protein
MINLLEGYIDQYLYDLEAGRNFLNGTSKALIIKEA